jgi:hypothetical protein
LNQQNGQMAMTTPAESARKNSGEVLREIAAHQGAAYRAYGEALERFGEGTLNTSGLLKEAGDLYFKEAGRVASGLFCAVTELYSSALGTIGARVLTPQYEPEYPKAKSKTK